MKYRPEIDGLRALAVVPVVLFHAGYEYFSGGFVGVDIFFVISGFLITTLILKDLNKSTFQLKCFFIRRMRRILPALILVTFMTVPFAWLWMLPDQFLDWAYSVVSSITSLSNFYFLSQIKYFTPNAEIIPLLHTWSLSIEEQYYLFYPFLLILIFNKGFRNGLLLISALVIAGVLIAETLSSYKPERNFFFSLSRFWEIFLGSAVAWINYHKKISGNDLLATIGIALIFASYFIFDESFQFPNIYTLVPTLGACLVVLYAKENNIISRLLSYKYLVQVGLLSYSIYLLHQPVLAFLRLRSIQPPTHEFVFISLILILVLSTLIWKYIEKPFRNPEIISNRNFLVILSVSVFFIIAIVTSVILANGLPGRFEPINLQKYSLKEPNAGACDGMLTMEDVEKGNLCAVGTVSSSNVTMALLGDSHASRLTKALKAELESHKKGFYSINWSWCPPLINFTTLDPIKSSCTPMMNKAYEKILADQTIQDIALFAEWPNFVWGKRFGEPKAVTYYSGKSFSSGSSKKSGINGNEPEFDIAVYETFSALKKAGKQVFIILPVPEYEINVRELYYKQLIFEGRVDISMPLADYKARSDSVRKILIKNAKIFDFFIVDPKDVFCDERDCYAVKDELYLYEDSNHLSYNGATLLVEHLVRVIGSKAR